MWRGLRRRCPRCGGSVIFERWMNAKEACPECDLRFEESGGDTWGFWVVLDRVFVVIPIVILFFGFAPAGKAAGPFSGARRTDAGILGNMSRSEGAPSQRCQRAEGPEICARTLETLV